MTRRLLAWVCAALLIMPPELLPPSHALAQNAAAPAAAAPPAAAPGATAYSREQLDALLAPIALYPDALLTQVLMASVFPLQVVEAARWLETPENAALRDAALATALEAKNWDPSVKSLVPFPQVLAIMNQKLDWMQQLGYAFATQQSEVLDSVQRLRRQAQAAGSLATTEQQVVSFSDDAVVITPANPQVVYVPTYNPTVVYGAWPYPTYPPVALPPPPGYAVGNALLTGLAFGAGVAVVASLWNVGTPRWGYGNVNYNVNRYNSINVNRTQINNPGWRAPPRPPGGGAAWRPPAGPVGQPRPGGGLPPNAIGRPSVSVPGNLVNRPGGAAGQRPGGNAGQRPGGAAGIDAQRPAGGAQRPNAGPRPNQPPAQAGGARGQRPTTPARTSPPRQPPAFNNMQQGNQAAQYGQRGNQSRQMHNTPARSGGARGGGARAGGGGGGRQR